MKPTYLLYIAAYAKCASLASSETFVFDDLTPRLAEHLGVSVLDITPRNSYINNHGTIAGTVFVDGIGFRSFAWQPGRGFVDVPNTQTQYSNTGEMMAWPHNAITGLAESGAVLGLQGGVSYVRHSTGVTALLSASPYDYISPITMAADGSVLADWYTDSGESGYGVWTDGSFTSFGTYSYDTGVLYSPMALYSANAAPSVVLWKRDYDMLSTLATDRYSLFTSGIQDHALAESDLQVYPIAASTTGTILANAFSLESGYRIDPYTPSQYAKEIIRAEGNYDSVLYSRPVLVAQDGVVSWLATPASASASTWLEATAMSRDARYVIGNTFDAYTSNTQPIVWKDGRALDGAGLSTNDTLHAVNTAGTVVFNRTWQPINPESESSEHIVVRYEVHPLLGDIRDVADQESLAVITPNGMQAVSSEALFGKNVYVVIHGWVPAGMHDIAQDPSPVAWDYTATWYASVAAALREHDSNAVVLGYSWIEGSATYLHTDAFASSAQAPIYGTYLANTLAAYEAAHPLSINLVGHSHGALVAMTAAGALENAGVQVQSLTLLDAPERSNSVSGGLVAYSGGSVYLHPLLEAYARKYGIGTRAGDTRVTSIVSEFGVPYRTQGVVNIDARISDGTLSERHAHAIEWYKQQLIASVGEALWWQNAPGVDQQNYTVSEKVMARFHKDDFLWASTMVFGQQSDIRFLPFDFTNEYAQFDRVLLTLEYQYEPDMHAMYGVWVDGEPFQFDTLSRAESVGSQVLALDISGIETGFHSISFMLHDGEGRTVRRDDQVGASIVVLESPRKNVPEPASTLLILLAFWALSVRRNRYIY